MPIALNYFLNVRDKDGQQVPFGKIGYQTMNPKTDRYTLANLAEIERALKAGELTDLDGNVVENGAVIDVYARVSLVADSDSIEKPSYIRNSAGTRAEIPEATEAPAKSDDDDTPF